MEFHKKSGLNINSEEIFVLILLIEREKEKYKLISLQEKESSKKLME